MPVDKTLLAVGTAALAGLSAGAGAVARWGSRRPVSNVWMFNQLTAPHRLVFFVDEPLLKELQPHFVEKGDDGWLRYKLTLMSSFDIRFRRVTGARLVAHQVGALYEVADTTWWDDKQVDLESQAFMVGMVHMGVLNFRSNGGANPW